MIVLCLYLEVGLRMVADGADVWGFTSDDDVAAVGALPDGFTVLGEHLLILNVL